MALLTTAAVVMLGVEEGIVLAVVVSIINHLRHSYRPLSSVLVKSAAGHWQAVPVAPGRRTEDGLVIYRFGTSPYYANASRLVDDVTALADQGGPLRWMVFDCAAIGDIDYTAAGVLTKVVDQLRKQQVRVAVSSVLGPVRQATRPLRHQRRPRPRYPLRDSRRGARSLPRGPAANGVTHVSRSRP